MAKVYGAKRDYKKIDIYTKGEGSRYLASTTWARNLRVAREKYAEQSGTYAASDLAAYYSAK